MNENREIRGMSREVHKLPAEQRESFKLFAMSVIGLSDGSAESYVSYVNGAARTVGGDADTIVQTRAEMQSALSKLAAANLNDGTRRNYIVGLRAYYRFVNGCEYYEQVSDSDVGNRQTHNVPFELGKELNELELRASDHSATFWHKILNVSLVVFTAVPTILAVNSVTKWAFRFSITAMVLGLVGVVFLVPILRRPIRQSDELYAYGRKLFEGSVSAYEFSPENKTTCEKICAVVAGVLIPLAIAFMVVAVLFVRCVK